MGVKPLYYAKDILNRLIFASEIKQLSHHKYIEKIEEFPKGNIFNGKYIFFLL